MPLIEPTLWGTIDRVQVAIERLKMFEPAEGYFGACSGGKDSVTIKALAQMAGVKVDWHYNLTTIDPPELVKFIRDQLPDVQIDKPRETMWQLIGRHLLPPTRTRRYCCEELKERGGEGRVVLTGIRAEESVQRKGRKMVEQCYKVQKSYVHVILDWSEQDVWQFIRENHIPYCSLYDEGFKRIGCIMCPFGSKKQRLQHAMRWPKYYQSYLRAFERLIVFRQARGDPLTWKTAQDMMDWWVNEPENHPDQYALADMT